MDRIHKRVQVSLHSCNITSVEYLELGDLAEFGGLKKKVEILDWLTLTPGWVDRPVSKEEGRRKTGKHGSRASSSVGGNG